MMKGEIEIEKKTANVIKLSAVNAENPQKRMPPSLHHLHLWNGQLHAFEKSEHMKFEHIKVYQRQKSISRTHVFITRSLVQMFSLHSLFSLLLLLWVSLFFEVYKSRWHCSWRENHTPLDLLIHSADSFFPFRLVYLSKIERKETHTHAINIVHTHKYTLHECHFKIMRLN